MSFFFEETQTNDEIKKMERLRHRPSIKNSTARAALALGAMALAL